MRRRGLALAILLTLPLASAAFEPDTDVIVLKDGLWIRGWVLREDGPDHHLIAYNWDADLSEWVSNNRIKVSTAPPPESKFVEKAYR